MRGITKRFPGITANSLVDLYLRRGEVLALLGENGAGKSTLMNILAGLYRPDGGEIHIGGRKVSFHSPREAAASGIGMVHQHFMLVRKHTVLENIVPVLPRPGFFPGNKRLKSLIAETAERFGLAVNPDSCIQDLSVGEQQRVEILKVLMQNAKILILDEPTAVLTPQESENFFLTLERLREEGCSAVFITHKLDEVLRISDRVQVLRAGKTAGVVPTGKTTREELARLMVGGEAVPSLKKEAGSPGAEVLRIEELRVVNDRGLEAVRGVSLHIREKEILGVAGVSGNGQREMAEALAGIRRTAGGKIIFSGREITRDSTSSRRAAGLRYVPEDRLGTALVPGLDLFDNSILGRHHDPGLGSSLILDGKAVRKFGRELISRFDIRVPDPSAPVRLLSGGNLQKIVLGRETYGRPRLLIASSPTRGLDIGAASHVHRVLLSEREAGTAILLISEDLDEVLELSDRVAVFFEGQITGIVVPGRDTRGEIGLLMGGRGACE
jgi:simple sugar transport system ATP-binding protein